MEKLVQGIDYEVGEDGLLVFTRHYLQKRGYCCENGCRHCPYGFRRAPAALPPGLVEAAAARRAPLLARQAENEAAGHDCARCAGTCCTFVANSMQVTPREALEVTAYLQAQPGGLGAWVGPLEETVRRFALDRPPPGDGRRSFGRRRYTCTFFTGGTLGCALPRDIKPTGCLAFNPRRVGQTEGGDCGTPPEFQAEGGDLGAGAPLPPDLAALFPWDLLPLPVALLTTWRVLGLLPA